MAQTTRRSRSQPQGFRQCTLRALHQPSVSRCETFCINGSMCCQALSDKHDANHSYAFVPVGGEGRHSFTPKLTSKKPNAGVCIHLLALLCFPLLRHRLRPRRTRGGRSFLERREIPLREKKKTHQTWCRFLASCATESLPGLFVLLCFMVVDLSSSSFNMWSNFCLLLSSSSPPAPSQRLWVIGRLIWISPHLGSK